MQLSTYYKHSTHIGTGVGGKHIDEESTRTTETRSAVEHLVTGTNSTKKMQVRLVESEAKWDQLIQ